MIWLQSGSSFECYMGEINIFTASYWDMRKMEPDTAYWQLKYNFLPDIHRPDGMITEKFATLADLQKHAEKLFEEWMRRAAIWYRE